MGPRTSWAAVALVAAVGIIDIEGCSNGTSSSSGSGGKAGTGTNTGAGGGAPTTGRLYVANDLDGSVSVIDTNTNTVVATLTDHPEGASFVDVDASLHRVYVVGGDLWSFNSATNQVVGTGAKGGIDRVVVDPIAHRAFGLTTNAMTSVLYFDLPGGTVMKTVPVATGAGFFFQRLAVDPSTGRVYVGDAGGTDVARSIWAL